MTNKNQSSDIFSELFENYGMRSFNKNAEKKREETYQIEKSSKKIIPSKFQMSLDLHGITTSEAPDSVKDFIFRARQCGMIFVLITVGMGRHSHEGKSKLRPIVVKTLIELEEKKQVKKFKTAEPRDGGYGAIYVYL